jgi:hypothetical protein
VSPDTAYNGTTGERFDDDRLLAFALGLDDDPELREALPGEAQLRERLQRIQADLGEVEAQVRAAVPPADEGWSDLSAARWDGLRPYLRLPQARPARRRRFGIRVLGPALAVAAAIALALGVTLSRGLFSGGGSTASDRAGGGTSFGAPTTTEAGGTFSPAYKAAAFQTIVVARAASVGQGEQHFDVLRVLKGSAPASVALATEVGGALPEGSLAVLYLLPEDKLATCPPSASPAVGTPSKQTGGITLYLYRGSCAAVQLLPGGTRPEDVTLP